MIHRLNNQEEREIFEQIKQNSYRIVLAATDAVKAAVASVGVYATEAPGLLAIWFPKGARVPGELKKVITPSTVWAIDSEIRDQIQI